MQRHRMVVPQRGATNRDDEQGKVVNGISNTGAQRETSGEIAESICRQIKFHLKHCYTSISK